MVFHASPEDLTSALKRSPLPILVEFGATWCAPCKAMAKILEDFSMEKSSFVFVLKIDVEEFPALAGNYGILSVPTRILFRGGKEVRRSVGTATLLELRELIR